MVALKISIDKKAVYDEVGQTTSYTGSKMKGDDDAFDRITATKSDNGQLERFWNECTVDVCEQFKRHMTSMELTDTGFILNLELSSAFEKELGDVINKEIFSYFVTSMASKWFAFTNKEESGPYADKAVVILDNAYKKACYKKKPSRPKY